MEITITVEWTHKHKNGATSTNRATFPTLTAAQAHEKQLQREKLEDGIVLVGTKIREEEVPAAGTPSIVQSAPPRPTT